MSTSAFNRAAAREAKLWEPFRNAMIFTQSQVEDRKVVFGLYSGAYINGHAYLNAFEAFELGMIIDRFDQNMAALEAEEQKAVMDIATRRYLSQVDLYIHQEKMVTKRADIDAEEMKWDFREAALEADRKALETLATKLDARQKEIQARVETLRASIELESMNLRLADIEVSRKELDISKANVRLSEKDIEISEKDIQISSKDLALSGKDLQISEQDLNLANKDLQISRTELQVAEKQMQEFAIANDILKFQLSIVETGLKELDTLREVARIRIETGKTQQDINKTAEYGLALKEAELGKTQARLDLRKKDIDSLNVDNEIAKIETRIAELELEKIRTDKEIASGEVDVANIEARIAKKGLLEIDLEIAKLREKLELKGFEQDKARKELKALQEDTLQSRLEGETSDKRLHDEIGMARLDAQVADLTARLNSIANSEKRQLTNIYQQILGYESQKQIEEMSSGNQLRIDESKEELVLQRDGIAMIAKRAAVEAAKILATANITSVLTHQIGKAL